MLGYFLMVLSTLMFSYGIFKLVMCVCCCQCDDNRSESNHCYFCNTYHKNEDKFLAHRLDCETENADLIREFPEHPLAKCLHCKRLLRLINHGPPMAYKFICDNEFCVKGDKVRSNKGNNRYNCFRCDYDLCIQCCDILVESYDKLMMQREDLKYVRPQYVV